MKSRNMTLYLSGPMTGKEDFNFPAFNAAAKALREMGYTVVNPAENDGGSQHKPRSYYLRLDIEAMLKCDAVVVLPGWRQSQGAKLEVAIARELEMAVYDVRSLSPIDDPVEVEPSGVTIFEEAESIVNGPRREAYGHPKVNHGRTAQMWSAFLGVPITAAQVCWCNILQKIAREVNAPKRDNLVDVAGYARNIEMMEG